MNDIVSNVRHRSGRAAAAGLLSMVVVVACAQPAWSGSQLAASEVVSGVVQSLDGKGPAANVPVHLMAYPNGMSLAATKVGDKMALIPLASGVTGSDGKYSLKIDPGLGLDRLASGDGRVDVALIAQAGNGLAARHFSIAIDGMDREPELAAAVAARNGRVAKAHKVGLALRELAGERSPDAGESAVGPLATCYATVSLVQNLGPRWVTVGMVSLKKAGVKAEFKYSNGSSSSLGIAISTNRLLRHLHCERRDHQDVVVNTGLWNGHRRGMASV